MNYYPHHIGDYLQATSHLNILEDGAYRRALDWCYVNEKPLPADIKQVCRYLRARDKVEIAAVTAILAEFFLLTDEGYTQSRCLSEIALYNSKADINRINGQKGGRPKQKPTVNLSINLQETQSVNSGVNSETQAKGNHKPRTINQEPFKINNKNDQGQNPEPNHFHGIDLTIFKKLKALYPEITEQGVLDSARFNARDVLLEMNLMIRKYESGVQA